MKELLLINLTKRNKKEMKKFGITIEEVIETIELGDNRKLKGGNGFMKTIHCDIHIIHRGDDIRKIRRVIQTLK